jgi:hypothetical protein
LAKQPRFSFKGALRFVASEVSDETDLKYLAQWTGDDRAEEVWSEIEKKLRLRGFAEDREGVAIFLSDMSLRLNDSPKPTCRII